MPPSEASVNQSAGASTFPSDSVRSARWLTFCLLLAGGTGLRLAGLTAKPFWFDECFSVEVARIDWRNFLHLLWWREANMTLYYLLLRAWLHFGQSEFYIRSLSVVIAVATIPAIYWLARLLYGQRVALIAAALFTFNAYNVRYAQEARSYALFMLLATLSSGFLIAWLREASPHLRSQSATSNRERGGRCYRPYVFTEHGDIMAACWREEPKAASSSGSAKARATETRVVLVA